MRMLRVAVAALVALIGGAVAADQHHDGGARVQGKGEGRHLAHQTRDGHAAHAHVNRAGKVFNLTASHPKDGNVRTKKVVTRQRRHALAPSDREVFVSFNSAEALTQGTVWVGWAFFNPYSNHWVFIWFPIDLVQGGDSGAEPID
jgi:hypothetical protein